MVRKRPAPDVDLPPPRRHVTGDLSDVTAATGGAAPPQQLPSAVAGSAQLPALPMQLPAFGGHLQAPVPAMDVVVAPQVATEVNVNNNSTAWVDGIIRDIIGSSGAAVSVAQLIHNVREIIHPCNPGLASLLELRLRSLLASDLVQHPPPPHDTLRPASAGAPSAAASRQAAPRGGAAEPAAAVAEAAPFRGGNRRGRRSRCSGSFRRLEGAERGAAAEAARRGGSPSADAPSAVRRVRQLRRPRRGPARPAGDRGAGHPVRHLHAARRRLLRGGHVGPPRQLLPRPLRAAPQRVVPRRVPPRQLARRRGVPGVQRHQPLRQVLPLHGEPGHPGGVRAGGPRPHRGPRHHAGAPVAGTVPHPRLPPGRPAQGQAHRARRVHGGAGGHREAAVGLRPHAGPAVRVLPGGGQSWEPRSGEARRRHAAARGCCRPLAPPLALRRHRQRLQHTQPHPKVGAEGGDNGGAGPEPLWLLSCPLRGGHPLLLGALRLAGREL
uniref:Uncharacterized protein n=1 Tax=Aegilops tauschii subsp. strangulata TaxID=200361 RepID=A0A453HPW2_AEGTS